MTVQSLRSLLVCKETRNEEVEEQPGQTAQRSARRHAFLTPKLQNIQDRAVVLIQDVMHAVTLPALRARAQPRY